MIKLRPENLAERAAAAVRKKLTLSADPTVGLILGTGWGDTLKLENAKRLNLVQLADFRNMSRLEGHERELVIGDVAGHRAAMLRGRVHLNEAPHSIDNTMMVRLQVETMVKLGIRQLILTCAAGALSEDPKKLAVGNLNVVDGFLTALAPTMPLFGGEFVSPEDALCPRLREIALNDSVLEGFRAVSGGHAMVRGPFFEGRRYDKRFMALSGVLTVGMSMLPEACVAALYPEQVKVLAIAYVTNGPVEEHRHETNLDQAKKDAERLGTYLRNIIALLP